MCLVSNSLIMSLQESSSDEEAVVDNGIRMRVMILIKMTSSFKTFSVHLEDQSGVLTYCGPDVCDACEGQGPGEG